MIHLLDGGSANTFASNKAFLGMYYSPALSMSLADCRKQVILFRIEVMNKVIIYHVTRRVAELDKACSAMYGSRVLCCERRD
ncbi:uncharacterized protein ARMOST_20720 [Armillaria ostoyae]|uniref:Uncharacterized protein n=1 Tax=Armillaria ostoyae TaxID=47428 RepID=A0A284S881_ARMOS|nr:uncharacterized protein ARMOST_20720 [Armillaria ostoyae]